MSAHAAYSHDESVIYDRRATCFYDCIMRNEFAARTALRFLLGISAILLPAFGQTIKLSTDLQNLLSNTLGSANVIVQFNQAPSILDLSQISILGGTVTRQYALIPAVAARLPIAGVLTLANSLGVRFVSLDRQLGATLDY